MALPASDTFLQSSGGPQALNVYSANWQQVQGTFNVPNGTGDVRCTASGVDHLARWTADAPNASQYSEIIPATGWAASGRYIGPAVRVSAAGDGYALQCTGGDWVLGRMIAGAWTTVASGSWTAVDLQPIRLEVETINTSTVRVVLKRNGATVTTYNDTSGSRITAANYLGLGGYDAAGSDPGIADWGGGNLAASSSEISGDATIDEPTAGGGMGSAAASEISGNATIDEPTAGGGIESAAQLSGDAAIDEPTAGGGLQSAAELSGDAVIDEPTAGGELAGGVSGVFTSEPLKRNNGDLAASSALTYVAFSNPTTGALVVIKTGLSTDAAGVFTATDLLLVPGTSYRADWLEATGQRGYGVKAAA